MKPAHPSEILKYDCIEPLGLTLTEVAAGLNVSRNQFSSLLNGRARISPDMAIKLSEAFGTTAEFWIDLQTQYDLWHANQRVARKSVRRFRQPA